MIETPLTLAHFTSPALMVPCLRGRAAAAVVGELAAVLERAGCVRDQLKFYNEVMSRGELVTSPVPTWVWPCPRPHQRAGASVFRGRTE